MKISFDAFTPTPTQDFTAFSSDASVGEQIPGAKVAGKAAAKAGKTKDDCPYKQWGPLRDAWMEGYQSFHPGANDDSAQERARLEKLIKATEESLKRPMGHVARGREMEDLQRLKQKLAALGTDKDFKNLNQGSSEGAGFGPPKKFEKA